MTLINSVRQGVISGDGTNWRASPILSSSLRDGPEGLKTVTDVAKCRGRIVSKMNLTFGVYTRPANCAPWERARETRRRELGAMPLRLISGAPRLLCILRRGGYRSPFAICARIYHSRKKEAESPGDYDGLHPAELYRRFVSTRI